MQLEGSDQSNYNSTQTSPCRMFECRTCDRQFQTFQALGGHRASHKKLRVEEGSGSKMMRAHECSVCGLEFAIGQALGGHMRRHRSSTHERDGFRGKKSSGKRVMCFDLNLPPPEEEEEDSEQCCCNKHGIRVGDCL